MFTETVLSIAKKQYILWFDQVITKEAKSMIQAELKAHNIDCAIISGVIRPSVIELELQDLERRDKEEE